MPRDTVAKTDGATVVFTKLPDGKFKAKGGTWDQEAYSRRPGARGPGAGRAASLPPAREGCQPPSAKDAILAGR